MEETWSQKAGQRCVKCHLKGMRCLCYNKLTEAVLLEFDLQNTGYGWASSYLSLCRISQKTCVFIHLVPSCCQFEEAVQTFFRKHVSWGSFEFIVSLNFLFYAPVSFLCVCLKFLSSYFQLMETYLRLAAMPPRHDRLLHLINHEQKYSFYSINYFQS